MKKGIAALVLLASTGYGAFAQPSNDLCENPITLSTGAGQNFTTEQAGLDGPEHPTDPCFSFGDDQVHNDVWYSYTAGFDGFVEWSTCGTADFDTRMAVYQAGAQCPLEDADLLACNDDGAGCADFTSYLIFPVSNGSTYLLRLGGYGNGDTGSGTFDLLETTPPPVPDNDLCDAPAQALVVSESDANAGLGWNNGTTIGSFLSGEIPECAVNQAGEFQDVWFVFNSGGNDYLEIRVESLTEDAEFGMDFFEACGVPVPDADNGGDFFQQCYSQADIDVFSNGIIEIGELQPDTDYLLRVSSQITYYPVGDFRFQLVETSSSNLDEPGAASFRVYPNPAQDVVTISAPGIPAPTVAVWDMSGRLLKVIPGSPEREVLQLDISALPSGMYTLEIADRDGNRKSVTRIIVL